MSRRTTVCLSGGVVVIIFLAIAVASAQGPSGGDPESPWAQKSRVPAPTAASAPGPATARRPTAPGAATAPTPTRQRFAAPQGGTAPMGAPSAVTAPTAMPGMPEVQPEITRTGFNFTTWLIIVGGLVAAGLVLRRYGAVVKEH